MTRRIADPRSHLASVVNERLLDLHPDVLVQAQRTGARVGRQAAAHQAVRAGDIEGSDEQGPPQPEAAPVTADRHLLDPGVITGGNQVHGTDDRLSAAAVSTSSCTCHGWKPGRRSVTAAQSSNVDAGRSGHSLNARSMTSKAAVSSVPGRNSRITVSGGSTAPTSRPSEGSCRIHEVQRGVYPYAANSATPSEPAKTG